MSLETVYNIPKETVSRMVKDGVISCSVARHYEIYDFFKKYKSEHPTLKNYELYEDVGSALKVSAELVKWVAFKFGKIS